MLASTLVRPASMFKEDLESLPAFSEDRYGSVPSFYIVCREDEQVPEEHQRWMTKNRPVREVTEIEAAGAYGDAGEAGGAVPISSPHC